MRKSNIVRVLKSAHTVFVLSILIAITVLVIERLVGIGWDYHPDARTYINEYDPQVSNIIESPVFVLNNFQYIVVWLFETLGVNLVFLNMILFAATNVMITKIHFSCDSNDRLQAYALLLLLLNPYRLHLSTTILKDTAIIFLVVCMIQNRTLWFLYIASLMYRVASLLYFPLFLSPKIFTRLSIGIIFVSIFFWSDLYDLLLIQNSAQMQFRDFDTVPNFTSLGPIGILIRCILWPVLGVSGLFFLISPSLQYLFVCIGGICTVFYILLFDDLSIYFPKIIMALMLCGIFAAVTTGFNSFIRYIYPILIALPLVLKNDQCLTLLKD